MQDAILKECSSKFTKSFLRRFDPQSVFSASKLHQVQSVI